MDSLSGAVAGCERTPSANPRYDNNRFGGQIGGPIIKNKLFFFTTVEYNPIGQVGIRRLVALLRPRVMRTLAALYPDRQICQQFQKYVPAAAAAPVHHHRAVAPRLDHEHASVQQSAIFRSATLASPGPATITT